MTITTTFPEALPLAVPRAQLWTGRVLTAIAVLFLSLDTIFKFVRPPEVVKGTTELGWPEDVILPLGIVCLVMLVLYLIPRTAVLGAVLWTGYLGGAVATHVRIHNPLFSHILFPVYVALLLWGGLWFRDRRLRALLPFA